MRRFDDRGAGLVGTLAGVAAFLVLLLFAVQLVFNLYATSTVTSVGYDAARSVASNGVDHDDAGGVGQARADAEARARRQLGRYGEQVSFDWSGSDGQSVRLRVRATNPRTGYAAFLSRPLGFDTVDRTVTVRVEAFR